MIAAELIHKALTAGVTLTPLSGGRLKLKGKPPIPANLTAALREHKTEVVAMLQSCATLKDLYRRYWDTAETEPMATFQSLHREIDIVER